MKKSILLSFAVVFLSSSAFGSAKLMEANISSAVESKLNGKVKFEPMKDGFKVTGNIMGLEPNSVHGFHVHEKGECKGPDYKSAGGHFNPGGNSHGKPNHTESHLGDLGNIKANNKGEARVDVFIKNTDEKLISQIAGKSLLIHAKADDLHTQPSGDSGARIGCGLIEADSRSL